MKKITIILRYSKKEIVIEVPKDTETAFNHELEIHTLSSVVKDSSEIWISDNYHTKKGWWSVGNKYNTLFIIPKDRIEYISIEN